MADGAASSQDRHGATARRRAGAAAGGERPPLVVLAGRAPVPRWAAAVAIGMPQLCRAGLSETWLLKEAGHRHWMMLAEAIGRATPDFEDEAGGRIYAAFTGVAVEEASFETVQEGDSLGFAGSIRRISHSQFMSEQIISAAGRPIATLRLISVFLRRRRPGQNGSIERAVLKHLPPFRAPPEAKGFAGLAYAFRAGHWDTCGGFRRLDRRLFRSFAVDPCPQADFNGADLLYFASFQAFVDRAEWAWFRYADPVAATRQRHIFYSGNIDLGDTLDIRLCGVTRGPRHCAHWCEIIRQSDGVRIAEVMTERVLAD